MGRIRPVTETLPTYDFLIYKDGDYYKVQDGDSLGIVYKDKNASTAIAKAINLLTPNRTWKEKIVLKGDIEISSAIQLPSYTTLEIQGILRQSNPNEDIIRLVGTASSPVTNVEVFGGKLIGSGNTGTKQTGVYLSHANHNIIRNLDISNLSYPCFYAVPGSYNIIDQIYAHDSYECGIEFKGASYHNFISNCQAINMFEGPEAFEQGYVLDLGASYNLFVNCYAKNCSDGFGIRTSNCAFNSFVNCETESVRLTGFAIGGSYNRFISCASLSSGLNGFDTGGSYLKFLGCVAKGNKNYGFNIDSSYNQLVDCMALENEHGFVISANENKIILSRALNNLKSGINLFSSPSNCIVVFCSSSGNTTNYSITGSNHIIKYNQDLTTENSGEATITAGDTYVDVSHGLDITPDINKIRITPKDNLNGRDYWISDVNSSTFRINISTSDSVDHTFGWSYYN